jgi:FPC/CPF motif-containing protein YcgG
MPDPKTGAQSFAHPRWNFVYQRLHGSLYGSDNPFTSPAAIRASNYCASAEGTLVRLLDCEEPSPRAKVADNALRAFISSSAFSCVAAKAALASGGYRFGYYRGFGAFPSTEGLARDLAAFVAERPSMALSYATFVAVFEEPDGGGERWFETRLWQVLQRLGELGARGFDGGSNISQNPEAPDFGFTFAGRAFFVVGMHPQSSRLSRRFFLPAMAFNAHDQFAQARQTGQFRRIQKMVRDREMQLQGFLNPELREFGERSEARQYSGRETESSWKCPFQPPS